jgi:DNA polymerase-3 subunit delta
VSDAVPIHIVRGSDPVLLGDAVTALVDDLVGDGDRGLLLDELAGPDYELAAVVAAAQTPPFLTDRRVVVARHAGRFSKGDDVVSLVQYLDDPLPTSTIVLVWELAPGQQRLSAVPKKLGEAVTAAGGVVVSTDPGSSKTARDQWWADLFAEAPVRLDRRAQDLVRERIGEDVGSAPALLRRLAGAHGEGAKLDVDAVEPLLGEAGSVPPWELTDSIDRGDTPGAIDALHRMLGSGDRHPLQLMATLQGHYLRVARLDGAGVSNERDAAAVLGIKGSTFPARKALNVAKALGPKGSRRAVALLAEADLTLRGGGTAWPGELVIEVLVARLSRLGGSRRR